MKERINLKLDSSDIGTYLTVLLMILAQMVCGVGGEQCRYERSMIDAGQIWRFVSGHFVHFSWAHLTLNVTGLLCLKVIFESEIKGAIYAAALALLSISISLMIWLVNLEVQWYVGFSGILTGLFVIAAGFGYTRQPLISAAVIVGLLVKISMEQWAGQSILSTAGGMPTVVDAHLYGFVLGALFLFLARTIKPLR